MHASFLPCTLYQCITVSPVQTLINLIPIIIKKYGTSLAQQRIRPMIRASSTEARSSQMELFRLKVLPLKGRALNTQFFGYQPQFAQYRATIDQGNIGLYHMWINSRNSEGSVELSGHTVTVTGYFTGHNGSSGIELQWLEVFDGWNTYPRAINYATPNMVKLNGTVFW